MSSNVQNISLTVVAVVVSLTCVLLLNFNFWHVVQEGHVGFYYRFGKLLEVSTTPGLHFKLPYPIVQSIDVYIRPQVDSVANVKCGAKDGTSILFPEIEIGNTLPREFAHTVIKEYGAEYDQFLIFKQVQYITNAICARFTSHEIAIEKFNELDDYLKEELEKIQTDLRSGIHIGFVRIAKPHLPAYLDKAYQQQAAERALKKAKEEEFKRIQQENLNEEEKVRGKSQRELIKAGIQNEMAIAKRQAKLAQEKIENEIKLEFATTDALIMQRNSEAQTKAIKLKAEANQFLLSKEYLELKMAEAILTNSKMIFGNEIPKNAFFQHSGDGGCSGSAVVAQQETGAAEAK